MHIELTLFAFADTAWQNMLNLDPEKVTWIEKIVRPIFIYAILIVLLRLFGKRELAQLNPFDLVVLLTLSNTVQNAIIGDDTSLSGGIVGAITLLAINYVVALLKYQSPKIERVIEGSAVCVIDDGKLKKSVLRRELLTREDLDILAHREGFESADDIQRCVLDPNGSFLVDGKNEIKDNEFKNEVIKKLDALTRQVRELKKAAG